MKCLGCESGYIWDICDICNGSGEGDHDGSVCRFCKGLGEKSRKCKRCDGSGELEDKMDAIEKAHRAGYEEAIEDAKRTIMVSLNVLNAMLEANSEGVTTDEKESLKGVK